MPTHYVGLDVHKVHTQICIKDFEGRVLKQMRVRTDQGELAEALANIPSARILLESSGSAEWVARLLESFGHEVIVADPGFVAMYGTVSRRIKTDARDAQALADACRTGIYRRAHRTSEEQRSTRRKLVARDVLVKARTRMITTCHGFLRQYGVRMPGCGAEYFHLRVQELDLPAGLREDLIPLVAALESVNAAIAAAEKTLEKLAAKSEEAARLQSLHGVGPVTALAFVSRVDDATRFSDGDQLSAYFGLVPSEKSSGEKRVQGRITKAGDKYVRTLMIQLAVRLMRMRPPSAAPLWMWAEKVQARRGKNVARVALARRLTRILFAMMKSKTVFLPQKLAPAA